MYQEKCKETKDGLIIETTECFENLDLYISDIFDGAK